ncbi:MATE family efflux transporter [Spirochaetia bacterium]|nr:MATE family efflux transporter [Spirochaetia bacterium]
MIVNIFKRLGPLSFYREALSIALPVMLQQLIMSMVSLIDNFMVAGLGDISMAAVNVSNQLNFIYIVIINAVCGAGGIYIAQFRGAGDAEGMRHAYRFKVIFGTAVSLVYFILCWTIPKQMLGMMIQGNAAGEEIISIGSGYLRLSSFTLLPLAFSFAIGSSFREIGRPKIPLFISAGATLVNTFGNWILIYGNLGAPRLEIAGAAIATIIARIFEAAAFLVYVYTAGAEKAPFFAKFRTLFAIKAALVRKILTKSAMMFLSELSWVSSETIMVALYNSRGGAEVVAGMAAGWTMANLFMILFGGIWTATAVLIGGALGAGRLEEAKQRAGWIKSGAVVLGCIVVVLGFGIVNLLVPLVFSNLTAQARSICLGMVSIILIYFPLWALLNSQFAITRSGGDAAAGMYTDVSVNTLIFVPGAFILAFCTSLGPVPMFAILKSTDIIKYFIVRHFYKKERWVKNLTSEE